MSSSPFPRARRRGPWIALIVFLLGLLAWAGWYSSGRFEAIGELEARAAIAKGQEFLKRGNPNQAMRAVDPLPENGPWAADMLTVKGLAFAALERPEQARPFLERSLKLDPKQPMAAKVLAAVYFSANESDRGLQMLDLAARLDPDDFRPWYAAGDYILTYLNQPADAVKDFKEALRRRPDHDESQIGLIDALLGTGSAAEATPRLEAALREHPGNSKVLCLAARHARLLGRSEEMARFAEQALSFDPDNVEALVLRAQFLHQSGRHDEALALAEHAVGLDPNSFAALSLLALIESSLGLKERAAATSIRHREARERSERIQQLTEQIKTRPNDPEPRWRMGQVAAQGGMTILAIKCFRAALALDPNCQPARDGLSALAGPRAGAGRSPLR